MVVTQKPFFLNEKHRKGMKVLQLLNQYVLWKKFVCLYKLGLVESGQDGYALFPLIKLDYDA